MQKQAHLLKRKLEEAEDTAAAVALEVRSVNMQNVLLQFVKFATWLWFQWDDHRAKNELDSSFGVGG